MKLQITMATALVFVLAGAGLSPQAQGATTSRTLEVDINVLAGGSCTFGNAGTISTQYDPANPNSVETVTSANVTCSFGTTWTLSYDHGLHADAGSSCASPARRANNGASYLAYELYRDGARTQPLGCDPTNGLQGSGTGGIQNAGTIYLRIPAGQSPTTTGAHADTVVATLTF